MDWFLIAIIAATLGVIVYVVIDYRADMRRLRAQIAVFEADESREWPTPLEVLCGLLFVVIYFGLIAYMGEAAWL